MRLCFMDELPPASSAGNPDQDADQTMMQEEIASSTNRCVFKVKKHALDNNQNIIILEDMLYDYFSYSIVRGAGSGADEEK